MNAVRLLKDNKSLVNYDLIQPIQKGEYGRSFLCKYEMFQLSAEIPQNDNFDGKYLIELKFKNQFGDTYQKDIIIILDKKYAGRIKKYEQGRVKLISKVAH